jgi:hypothetical protein
MTSSIPQAYPVSAEGVEFNPSNIFKFMAAISPIMLTWFLAAASIFNQDIKGIIYLAGLLLAICINVLFSNMLKKSPNPERSGICELFHIPFASNYTSPSINSLIIAFTSAYLIAPMHENNTMNYGIIAFLMVILVTDGTTKVTNLCNPIDAVVLGTILGGLLGYLWFAMLKASGNDSLLYYNEILSNNAMCKVPKKQTFKCNVFKGGKLVDTL